MLLGNDMTRSGSPVFDLAAGRLDLRGPPVIPLERLQPRGPVVTVPLQPLHRVDTIAVTIHGESQFALLNTGMPYTRVVYGRPPSFGARLADTPLALLGDALLLPFELLFLPAWL